MTFKAYEKAVEEHYKVYAKVFNFVRAKIHKDFQFLQIIARLFGNLSIHEKNEDRFGMDIKMADLMKVAKKPNQN